MTGNLLLRMTTYTTLDGRGLASYQCVLLREDCCLMFNESTNESTWNQRSAKSHCFFLLESNCNPIVSSWDSDFPGLPDAMRSTTRHASRVVPRGVPKTALGVAAAPGDLLGSVSHPEGRVPSRQWRQGGTQLAGAEKLWEMEM